MPTSRIRGLIPVVYGLLVVAAFIVSATVGLVVLVAGGAISGLLWSALSGRPGGGRDRSARAEARSSRRPRG